MAEAGLARCGPARRIGPPDLLGPHTPDGFFHTIEEDDLLPLGRLNLEGRGVIEA